MIVKLYAVVDKVSGVFDGPHKAINEGQFLRGFQDQINNPDSPIARHPEDFYVVELGSFNDANGDIVGLDQGATRIATGTDFLVLTAEDN